MSPFSSLEAMGRLLLAALLGGVIGYERETEAKPAGLRDMMLVALGSCLFMVISIAIAPPESPHDPGRIAAQVVTGIGFLGAGVILRARGQVYGVTTAAAIWVVAGIGMAAGAGMYLHAVGATVLSFLVIRLVGAFYKGPPPAEGPPREGEKAPREDEPPALFG